VKVLNGLLAVRYRLVDVMVEGRRRLAILRCLHMVTSSCHVTARRTPHSYEQHVDCRLEFSACKSGLSQILNIKRCRFQYRSNGSEFIRHPLKPLGGRGNNRGRNKKLIPSMYHDAAVSEETLTLVGVLGIGDISSVTRHDSLCVIAKKNVCKRR
jgi:hypothetical protein